MAEKPKKQYFTKEIQDDVKLLLAKKYSPEQIAGMAKKESFACVSYERIYQYIWDDKKQGGSLHTHLRNKGKRYRKRGSAKDSRGIITGRIDISKRPAVVEQRERFGDLEIDTIIGKNHKGAIVTINDRATGMLKMKKVSTKEAEPVKQATIELLKDWKPFIHTLTADNGKEFALHHQISQSLQLQFFFAKPYHSWERGSNENLNGLIRQYIPKKTDFNTLTDIDIQYIEDELNNRPRKRYNFETPLNQFNQLTNQKVAFKT